MILFGGLTFDYKTEQKLIKKNIITQHDIYVFDLITKQWYFSKINIPIKNASYLATTVLELNDPKFVTSYVKYSVNITKYVPNDIIIVINNYFDGIEYIHLIHHYNRGLIHENQYHWKTRLDKIIKNLMIINTST